MNDFSSITVQGLALSVLLGFSQTERAKRQTVLLDITLQFTSKPLATKTDKLSDTICYHALIRHLEENITDKEFHLIEHLSDEILQSIKAFIPPGILVRLVLTKKPAIKNLTGGVSFSCEG